MTSLDQTFAALGDGTRRAILTKLSLGEASLSEIAKPCEITQTGISKHVRVLSEAGLVEVTKRGRTRYCRIKGAPMKAANDWLSSYQGFWESSFGALSAHLEDNT